MSEMTELAQVINKRYGAHMERCEAVAETLLRELGEARSGRWPMFLMKTNDSKAIPFSKGNVFQQILNAYAQGHGVGFRKPGEVNITAKLL